MHENRMPAWSRLRLTLQLAAAAAMTAQREELAVVLGGVSMLVQSIEDRHAAGGVRKFRAKRRPGGVSARGRLPLKVVRGLQELTAPRAVGREIGTIGD